MEAETIEKEEYRKMSGMQELQWSKGNDPVLTPPNFIETNLMTITDQQFLEAIAQRYGVNLQDYVCGEIENYRSYRRKV